MTVMSKFCPNINSDEFKSVVSAVGENEAYAIWDRNKGFSYKFTPKGEESRVFQRLLDQTGSLQEAIEYKNLLYGKEFLESFGDWTEGKGDSKYLDSRGEPNVYIDGNSLKFDKYKSDNVKREETINRHKNRVEKFLNGENLLITKEHIQNYFRYYNAVSPYRFMNTEVHTLNRTQKGNIKGDTATLTKNTRKVNKLISAFYERFGYSPVQYVTQYGGGVIYHEDLFEQSNREMLSNNPSIGTVIDDLNDTVSGEQLELDLQRKDYSLFNIPSEDIGMSRRKIDHIKTILGADLDIHFIEDRTLDGSGKLLSSTDPLSKKIGKPVIVINPDNMYQDTVYHELSHLFIELAGGINNGRINAAVKKLRNTDLWREVSLQYPELNNERLGKEVLATALGMEASDLFDTEFNKTWWKNFIEWFFNILGIKLNVKRNVIESLAKDIYQGRFHVTTNRIKFSEYLKRDLDNETRKKIDSLQNKTKSLEELYTDSVERIDVKLNFLKNKRGDYKKFIKELNSLREEMEITSKQSYALALYKFVQNANLFLNARIHYLSDIDWSAEKNKGKSKFIDDMYLHNLQSYVGTYNMIPQIVEKLRSDKGFDSAFKDEDTKVQLIRYLNEVESNFGRINELIKHHIRQRAIFNLSSNSNFAQGKARRDLEREANSVFADVKDKELKKEKVATYVNNKLEELKETFFDKNLEHYTNVFEEGMYDVSGISSYLSDPQNMNSLVVQVFDKIIDEAELKVREFTQRQRDKYYNVFDNLENFTSDGTKFYKNILEFDNDGKPTGYLIGKYKSEFYETYMSHTKKYRDLVAEHGEDSDQVNEFTEEVFNPWLEENTKSSGKNGWEPADKWKTGFDIKNLSDQDRTLYQFFLDNMKVSDAKTKRSDSLIKTIEHTTFYKIPIIAKKNIYEMGSGGVVENVKGVFNSMFKHQGDDVGMEYGDSDRNATNIFKVFADEANRELVTVPIYFRNRKNISPSQQSYDLLTVMLMNDVMAENYAQKTAILPSLDIITSAVEESNFFVKKRGKLHVNINRKSNKPIVIEGKKSNTFKVLNSIIEDRVLGVGSIYAGEIFGMDTNKVMNQIAGWTAGTMLGLNYMAATVNIMQGTITNWIYNISRGDISKKDWLNGEKYFWKDISNWSRDIGSIRPKSKTNLIAEKLNIFSDFKTLHNSFSEDNKFKTLLKRDSLFFMNHGGEFYMQSTLMYTLMSKIKVMNADKQFIDSKGNVVSEDKAASLSDMWEIKDGVAKINDNVKYTSFDTVNEISEVAISNYIKDVLADLHGQYDSNRQSMFQRTFYGKMLMMLRKWLVRGTERRWRGINNVSKKYDELENSDEFYSESTMEFKEGTYTALARFIYHLTDKADEMSFRLRFQTNWNSLTAVEKANIHQSISELAFIAASLSASVLLYNLAKNADDDEKPFLFFSTFVTRRLYSEFFFYSNPFEMVLILRSPAASLAMIQQVREALHQLVSDPLEEYERGNRKGTYKLWKEFGDVAPVVNQLNKNIETSTEYIFSGI